MAPAKGWPIPHSRFCSASENAKTSRPQPLACDIGVRKNPSDERGPNARADTRQPQSAMTSGARQLASGDDMRRGGCGRTDVGCAETGGDDAACEAGASGAGRSNSWIDIRVLLALGPELAPSRNHF